jgi:hypothetical protein
VEQEQTARAHAVDRSNARHPGQHAVETQAERAYADQPVGKPLDGLGVTPGLVRLVAVAGGPFVDDIALDGLRGAIGHAKLNAPPL